MKYYQEIQNKGHVSVVIDIQFSYQQQQLGRTQEQDAPWKQREEQQQFRSVDPCFCQASC